MMASKVRIAIWAICIISTASLEQTKIEHKMAALKNLYEKGLLSDQVYTSQRRKLVGNQERVNIDNDLPALKLLAVPSEPLVSVITQSFLWFFFIILGSMVWHMWSNDDYQHDAEESSLYALICEYFKHKRKLISSVQ